MSEASRYPLTPLGTAIRHRKQFFEIDDFALYKRCRVQLHAAGIVLRDEVWGSEIKTKRQQACRAGDFLVAEIDAKHGGFGIVPDDLDGAVVSSHYFLFEIDESVLDRRYLDFYVRTRDFRDQVQAQGSTNYAAIRSQHVLEYTIPLPPLAEQRRVVARVEALAAKVDEARGLRQVADHASNQVLDRALDEIFEEQQRGAPTIQIDEHGAFVTSGPRGWGDYYDADGQRRLIRVENVTNRAIDLTTAVRVAPPADAGDITRSEVMVGDVLVTITGAIGRVGVVKVVERPSHVSQHVALVRPPKHILSDYLYWFLRSPTLGRTQTEGQTYGATKPGINLSSLRHLRVPAPSLTVQEEVVRYLDDFEGRMVALDALQRRSRRELEALMAVVLNTAFEGKL